MHRKPKESNYFVAQQARLRCSHFGNVAMLSHKEQPPIAPWHSARMHTMPSSLVPWKSCGRFALLAAFALDPHAMKSVVSKCLATNSLPALRPSRRRSRNNHGMRNNRSRTSSSQFACALPLPRSATCQPKRISEPFRRLQQPLVGLQEHSQRVPPPRLEQLASLLQQALVSSVGLASSAGFVASTGS